LQLCKETLAQVAIYSGRRERLLDRWKRKTTDIRTPHQVLPVEKGKAARRAELRGTRLSAAKPSRACTAGDSTAQEHVRSTPAEGCLTRTHHYCKLKPIKEDGSHGSQSI